jgi:hypothetical protein
MRRPSLPAAAAPAAAAAPGFTASPDDYRLMEEIGFGANAVVYRAVFLPAGTTIAVKCLDLDRVNSNLVRSLSLCRYSLSSHPLFPSLSRAYVLGFRGDGLIGEAWSLWDALWTDAVGRAGLYFAGTIHPVILVCHCMLVRWF